MGTIMIVRQEINIHTNIDLIFANLQGMASMVTNQNDGLRSSRLIAFAIRAKELAAPVPISHSAHSS